MYFVDTYNTIRTTLHVGEGDEELCRPENCICWYPSKFCLFASLSMQWHVNFEVGMMTCRCFTTVNHCCTPPRKQWSFHIQVELKLVREVNERVGGFFYELLFVVLIRIDGLILGFPLCFWKVKVYTCTCSILITDTTWLQPDRTEPCKYRRESCATRFF